MTSHLHRIKQHWPVAAATLIFLIGSLRKAMAAESTQLPSSDTNPIYSPFFLLCLIIFVLIATALLLIEKQQLHKLPKAPKSAPKKKPRSSKSR